MKMMMNNRIEITNIEKCKWNKQVDLDIFVLWTQRQRDNAKESGNINERAND